MHHIKPNKGKNIEIVVQGECWNRYPIKTDVFAKGDNYAIKIAKSIKKALHDDTKLVPDDTQSSGHWYILVSEKIVAISQGRSYFIKDIRPSWWATTLSRYVKKTPHGIGLGSPWTMELAIGEVGLLRILFAALLSVVTKPFGLSGVFYHVAGRQAAAIDGPTSYSLYPSNVSAKLAPKDPQKVAEQITTAIKSILADKTLKEQFGGAVVIDANDLGRHIMGNATDRTDRFFEDLMRDNPMGQGSEQTPIVVAQRT